MNLNMQKVSFFQHIYRWLLRLVLVCYHGLMLLFKLTPRRINNDKKALKILATGTFYSDHWLVTHLRPMANAGNCAHLAMVAATPVPEMDKVTGVYAPRWLQKISGQVGARLLYFSWLAVKERPDVLVGFHLLVNGLFVALLARLIGSKSVYICGGGPREVEGGGINTENRIFKRIGQADCFIESQLVKAVNEMDLVISMGTSAIDYFREKGVETNFQIVPGGFDANLFAPAPEQEKIYDLILIGRLSDVKRVDRFLHALKQAKEVLPNLNAVIVGDGPDKVSLEQLSQQLGICQDVHFAGWQNNVHTWLQKSRCFVLASDSEGLSQALIQAMMTGLPAITSDVGDLGDLLQDNRNGYLISSLNPDGFSTAFVHLFRDEPRLKQFSAHAYQSTRKFSVEQVEMQWERIFQTFVSIR